MVTLHHREHDRLISQVAFPVGCLNKMSLLIEGLNHSACDEAHHWCRIMLQQLKVNILPSDS